MNTKKLFTLFALTIMCASKISTAKAELNMESFKHLSKPAAITLSCAGGAVTIASTVETIYLIINYHKIKALLKKPSLTTTERSRFEKKLACTRRLLMLAGFGLLLGVTTTGYGIQQSLQKPEQPNTNDQQEEIMAAGTGLHLNRPNTNTPEQPRVPGERAAEQLVVPETPTSNAAATESTATPPPAPITQQEQGTTLPTPPAPQLPTETFDSKEAAKAWALKEGNIELLRQHLCGKNSVFRTKAPAKDENKGDIFTWIKNNPTNTMEYLNDAIKTQQQNH